MIALNLASDKQFSNILLHDWNPAQLRLYQAILRRAGLEPLCTEDEKEALDYLAANKQLLVISCSYELLVKIRSSEDYAEVSIIIASIDTSIEKASLEAGANAFLLRPASPKDIINCIRNLR